MAKRKSHPDSKTLQSEVWIDIPIDDLMKKRSSKNAENVELVHSPSGTSVHPTTEHSVQMRKHDKAGRSEQHNTRFKMKKEQSHYSSKCHPLGNKELFETGSDRSRILEQCRSDGNENRRTIKTKEISSDSSRQAQYLESRDIFETGGDSLCNPRQSNRRNRDVIETRGEPLCTPKPGHYTSRTLLETGRDELQNLVSSPSKSRYTFEASEGRQFYDSSSSHRKKRVGLKDGREHLQNPKIIYRRNIDASRTVSYSPIPSHRKNRHRLEAEDDKPYNPKTNYFKNNYAVEEDRLRNPRISYKNIDALQAERDSLNDRESSDHLTRDKLGTVGSKLPNPKENPRITKSEFEVELDQSTDLTPSHHESKVTSEANENSNASLIVSETESRTSNFALTVSYWRCLGSWCKISQFRKQLQGASLSYFFVLIVSIICIVVAVEVGIDMKDIPLSILMACIVCSTATLLCDRGCLLNYIERKVRLSEGRSEHNSEYDFRPTCKDFFFCCFRKNNIAVPSRRSQYARRSEINTAFEHEIADVSNISPKKCPQPRLVEETEFANSKSPDNSNKSSKTVAADVHLSETSEKSRNNVFICEHFGQNVACGCSSKDQEKKSKFSNTSDLSSNNETQDGRCDKLKRKNNKRNTSPFLAANSQLISTLKREKYNEYPDEINENRDFETENSLLRFAPTDDNKYEDGEYRHAGRLERLEETYSRYSMGDDEVFIQKDSNSSNTHKRLLEVAQESKRKVDDPCSPALMSIKDGSESKNYALDESIPKFSQDPESKTPKTRGPSNFVSRCQHCGEDIRNSVDNITTFFSRTSHVCKNDNRNASENAAGKNIVPQSSKMDDDDDDVYICEHFGLGVACACAEIAQKKSPESRGPSL